MNPRAEESSESSEEFTLSISEQDKEQFARLDHLLCHYIDNKSRSFIKKIFEKEMIEAFDQNNQGVKLNLSKLPPVGTSLVISFPPPIPTQAKAEKLDLEIVYQDQDIIIVNKAAGMVTHPAPGNYQGTLVNALLFHCKDLGAIGETVRPGIVHRLDKGTSGIMVVAKNMKAFEGLVWQFSDHSIHRKYRALAFGQVKNLSGTIESFIGRSPQNRLKMTSKISSGKRAVTHYKRLEQFALFSHMELKLETGRTHQIRVHLSEVLQNAILCDDTYANVKTQLRSFEDHHPLHHILASYPYPLLHAKELGFKHPVSGKELFFDSELPAIFNQVLEASRKTTL